MLWIFVYLGSGSRNASCFEMFQDVPLFSESFQVHFHMFDVFGASGGSLKTPCVYLIYF